MTNARNAASALTLAAAALLAACSGGSASNPLAPGVAASSSSGGGTTTAATGGSVRLRCELRAGRSKISVDGRDLRPANGVFSARVEAAGGTAASGMQQAVLGEAEFDFDSDAGDIAAGATAIAASFIAPRPGADVNAAILDAQGNVVATGGADCEVR